MHGAPRHGWVAAISWVGKGLKVRGRRGGLAGRGARAVGQKWTRGAYMLWQRPWSTWPMKWPNPWLPGAFSGAILPTPAVA